MVDDDTTRLYHDPHLQELRVQVLEVPAVELQAELGAPLGRVIRSNDLHKAFPAVLLLAEPLDDQVFQEARQEELLLDDAVHARLMKDLLEALVCNH